MPFCVAGTNQNSWALGSSATLHLFQLSLSVWIQVFGQTPLYISGTGRWCLVKTCPLLEGRSGRKREEGPRAGEGRSRLVPAEAPLWLCCSCRWAIISLPAVISLLSPGRSAIHCKSCCSLWGLSINTESCVAAQKDTNISPLSWIPPEFNSSKALLLSGLAPHAFPHPHSRLQRSDPETKRKAHSSGSPRGAAVPGLWEGGRGEAGGGIRLRCGDASSGCNSSVPLVPQQQHRHKATGRLPHLLPLQQGPVTHPQGRQEPAPCSQLILPLGNAGCSSGLAGKAPAA